MSNLIRINHLHHTLGGRVLFEDLSVSLDTGDRVGLVGHNGCGKSSLLGIVAGRLEPDQGDVQCQRGLRVMAVEQFLPADLEQRTLVDAVSSEPWRAEALLAALGFSARDFDLEVWRLSGGQQNRLMFARAIIDEPDVLLLDEPTNHLDLRTMVLFEQALSELNTAFILVSHDRSFLDAVTDHTWVLRDGRIYRYDLPYSAAREALQHHDETAAHTRAQEEKKIDALRASAKRLNLWGRVYDNEKLARRGRAIDRRADKLEADKTFTTRGSPLSLSLQLGDTRAKEIVRITGHKVRAGERVLFHIEELLIRPADRVALLGHNGVGKSTFIRTLVGADADTIQLRPQTQLGYYDQELDQVRGRASIHSFVHQRVDVGDEAIHRALIHAGFAYDQHDKRLNDLSGGERARVLFVALSLQRPNFLVLDEPTNHIDLEGKEQLEAQLRDSDAALLITSHDRTFINNVADRFLWVCNGGLREISDPHEFFASNPSPASATATAGHNEPSSAQETSLQRLLDLEEKLAADRARKPKFQKPELQAQWAAEIDRLYALLDQET